MDKQHQNSTKLPERKQNQFPFNIIKDGKKLAIVWDSDEQAALEQFSVALKQPVTNVCVVRR